MKNKKIKKKYLKNKIKIYLYPIQQLFMQLKKK